jgi:hypothetical protein
MSRMGAVVAWTVGMTGCTVTSVEALYTERDRVFDPALPGVWRNAEQERDTLMVMQAGAHEYTVVRLNDSVEVFKARLVDLGGARFVDIRAEPDTRQPGFSRGLWIQGHAFGRISLAGDKLTVRLVEPDWTERERDAAAGLRLSEKEDRLVSFATTTALREFAAKQAWGDAFASETKWTRVR